LASLAADLVEPERKTQLLAHTNGCIACGAMLREIEEDFSAEISPAEQQEISALRTASPDWQREMARKLADAGKPSMRERLSKAATDFWKGLALRPARLIAQTAAVLLVAAGSWAVYLQWFAARPARLLAQAYTEQRPFEYRIPGAEHAPVRVEKRGAASPFQKPAALLKAVEQIARKLDKDPDNADWLGFRARAELLSWDAESAIATLTRALDLRPNDPELMADLGMAYALRAETGNRAVDYGYAIEYLSRSLQAKPDLREARFNRAVVYERMLLVDQAIEQWRQYLKLYATNGWAEEARRRLAELEKKKKARKEALDKISDDPLALLRRIGRGEAVEPEDYLDVAAIRWLPHRSDPASEQALQALALLFGNRHGDRWLRDALAARRSEELARGWEILAAAATANREGQAGIAKDKAAEASRMLRAAGDSAGALQAEAEHVYALSRSFEAPECLERALALEPAAGAAGYAWISAQVRLELGQCRIGSGESGDGYEDMKKALSMAKAAGYRVLELRAEALLAGEHTSAGNLLAAWDRGREGLVRFWDGTYPSVRAQQLYVNLRQASARLDLPNAAYAFARGAVVMIAETTYRVQEAIGRMLLGNLAAEAGWPEEADVEYERAEALFQRVQQTKIVQERRLFAQVYRAETEVSRGVSQLAIQRMNGLNQQAVSIGSLPLQLRIQQVLGEADWRTGKWREAEAAYRAAVELQGRRLGSLREVEERSASLLAAGKAYRGLAEIRWMRHGDIAGAFDVWERFRSGERAQGGDRKVDASTLSRETFVAYASLPGRLVAWVFDDRGIEGRELSVTPAELENASRRFLRLCSDPASSQVALRQGARQIYDWLIGPIAHRLEPSRTLVLSPDGPIGAIPVQALMDEKFQYLGERFMTVVASGVADYQRRAAAAPLGADSQVLVIANPMLGEDMRRAFPPLLQTEREGKAVAALFPRSTVLTGKAATPAAVERYRSQTELLHFAGHGFSHAGNGGLLLAPAEEGALGVEVMDGKRLAGKDWSRCLLAVLSACSTGTGEARGPTNPESLVRRMLWAGVARVVASRWNIDAETSGSLMASFYAALRSGFDVPAALRQSSNHVRAQRATSHPYYWAGFQTFGSR
jgi:CHAT domain-containing protein